MYLSEWRLVGRECEWISKLLAIQATKCISTPESTVKAESPNVLL